MYVIVCATSGLVQWVSYAPTPEGAMREMWTDLGINNLQYEPGLEYHLKDPFVSAYVIYALPNETPMDQIDAYGWHEGDLDACPRSVYLITSKASAIASA